MTTPATPDHAAVCPACQGKTKLGIDHGGVDGNGHVVWSEPTGWIDCYRCDGTGVIAAEEAARS
jgi:hypothetical protein